MRAGESPNYSDLRLRRERNRWFADSPLEGGGFELPVPRAIGVPLSRLFRRLFLAQLADADAKGQLTFFGEIELNRQ
jgi:hypothetical protein